MTIADDYRINANRCFEEAKKANKSEDHALWLSLAENWLSLAQEFETVSDQMGLGENEEGPHGG